jgi:hypothetical protein
MNIIRDYNYEMGFAVNGSPIPDPAVFSGKASALDSEGGRDANGLLHRKMVATKHPLKLEYHAITFAMMRTIMNKMTGESFRFTYPDPRDGLVTIKAYVGDRDWEVIMAREAVDPDGKNNDWKKNWFGDLSFSIIEF